MPGPVGLSFTEQMKGFYQPGHRPENDYEGAFRLGRTQGLYLNFETTITIDDIERFLADPSHEGAAEGWIACHGLAGRSSFSGGAFNLFSPGESERQRKMRYLLPFAGQDGSDYLLDGFKDVVDDPGIDIWRDTSTLFTLVRKGHHASGEVIGTGLLTIHIPDFIKQLASFRVHGTESVVVKAETLAKFGRFFAGELWDVFAKYKL